jgi:hypothetical protein
LLQLSDPTFRLLIVPDTLQVLVEAILNIIAPAYVARRGISWVKESIDLLLFISPSQTFWHLALTRVRLLQHIEFTYVIDSFSRQRFSGKDPNDFHFIEP